MMWTPYMIEIMLHCHCCHGPFERWDAPIFEETVQRMISAGVIEPTVVRHSYKSTERGKALVDMWCSTPLPENRWIDPRFEARA